MAYPAIKVRAPFRTFAYFAFSRKNVGLRGTLPAQERQAEGQKEERRGAEAGQPASMG